MSQDMVRREMLKVHDREGNLSIDLIRQIAEYGKGKCEYVIVEGILYKHRYGEMLHHLIQFFDQKALIYYFDLSFEETLKRHNASTKQAEFGEDSLRDWWHPNDYLGADGEVQLTDELSQSEVVERIFLQL